MVGIDTDILAFDDGPVVEVINPGATGPVVLACEHASPFIPASLNGLGLSEADRLSHAVWDPGALALARAMSAQLQAPLVAARVSRLVYDCNRPPEAAAAMPAKTELIDVPGNHALSADQRAARTRAVYVPFRDTLAQVLDRQGGALVTVHSFTPSWFGTPRATEVGLLHDTDDRLARAMLENWSGSLKAELNAPYSSMDGVTHTLATDALPRGRLNVMIEVRNDLLADEDSIHLAADELCAALSKSLAQLATAQGDGQREGHRA